MPNRTREKLNKRSTHLLDLLPFLRLKEFVHNTLKTTLHTTNIQPRAGCIGERGRERGRGVEGISLQHMYKQQNSRELTFSPESSTAKLVL
jgi:hypothetical protein